MSRRRRSPPRTGPVLSGLHSHLPSFRMPRHCFQVCRNRLCGQSARSRGRIKIISLFPVTMDGDIEADCVRWAESHTRNLLRVKRGIDMVKVLFEHIISLEYVRFFGTFEL
ncbi:hypothetical protein PHJA_002279400 [Phtheirospermum japonicum]|uniref:Uncharacterized protein n=1 Tax=Phtheirospermum japonicum TaxID=374723 RepID=A0A830CYW0_9LAMI|nr:hypothetical protein PHJA_002279400 [Phtheirospermum japonicum]